MFFLAKFKARITFLYVFTRNLFVFLLEERLGKQIYMAKLPNVEISTNACGENHTLNGHTAVEVMHYEKLGTDITLVSTMVYV